MSDNTSVTDPPDQGEPLHRVPQPVNPSRRRGLTWLVVSTILLMAVILLNLWQLRQNLKDIAGTSSQRQFWILCHGAVTDAERKAAFLGLLKAGNTEWRSANLKNLDLSELVSPRIQVENGNFENSSLAGAKLSNSDFSFSQFQLVDFTEADLSSSNLIEAYLLKAILNNADFNNTNLQRAMIEQVTAHQLNLENADLSEAHLLLADLTNSNLVNTNLTLVNLEAATLEGCDLSAANMEGALLLDTDFTDSNWWRAQGLSSETIEDLLQSFPPSPEIKPEWGDDFKKWLDEFTLSRQNAKPDDSSP